MNARVTTGKNATKGSKASAPAARETPQHDETPSPTNGKKEDKKTIAITPPNLVVAEFNLVGTAPYVQHAFSQKAMEQIHATQAAGQQARGKKVRVAKDFSAIYEGAKHKSTQGWLGQPASGYRNAMISACRLVGFAMTRAKLSFFVLADGYDAVSGDGLVRIYGEPEPVEHYARNDNGSVDLRVRPMWREWTAKVRIQFDEDQFSTQDVLNLLLRAGMQVGVGEGRHDSKNSAGMGWGSFTVANSDE